MTAKREIQHGADRWRRPEEHGRAAGRRRTDSPSRKRDPRAGGSAPDKRSMRSGPQTGLIDRPTRPKNTSQAKARSKARKAKAPKAVRPPLRDRLIARLAEIDLNPRTLAAKVPFVVLVIGSLGVGLALTLWLSTDSAERSYQLGNARETTRALTQQKEALERDVMAAQAAPALAEAARNLGMIPSQDTAHLVQDPAGNWIVVGTPKPAEGAPPPPLNTPLPVEKPPSPTVPVDRTEVPVVVTRPPVAPAASPAGTAPTPPAAGPEMLVRIPVPADAPAPVPADAPAPAPADAPAPAPAEELAAAPALPAPDQHAATPGAVLPGPAAAAPAAALAAPAPVDASQPINTPTPPVSGEQSTTVAPQIPGPPA